MVSAVVLKNDDEDGEEWRVLKRQVAGAWEEHNENIVSYITWIV